MKLNSQQNIADSFAKHFAKAYTQSNDMSPDYYKDNETLLKDLCAHILMIDVTEESITDKVHQLSINTLSGPDEILNVSVKRCIQSLITPITRILSNFFKTGFVPNIWKSSFVRPVHKSGVKANIENYRGVALQCVIPKVLDSFIPSHINVYVPNIIDESQHGFVKGKKILTNLAEFTSSVLTNMERHIQSDAIYLDIAKAFDSVSIKLPI